MIEIRNMSKKFNEQILFDDFNLEIDDGEFVVIMGPSGSGKTTLLNIIGGIEPFDLGEVVVNGVDISKSKNKLNYFKNTVGFLFQNFALVENKTVIENLQLIKNDCRSDVLFDAALERVGLCGVKEKKVYKLSGGEQQRVAMARALINRPPILLCDEPTGNLDSKSSQEIMELLKYSNKKYGQTLIVITHDENIALQADRIIRIADGQIVSDEKTH